MIIPEVERFFVENTHALPEVFQSWYGLPQQHSARDLVIRTPLSEKFKKANLPEEVREYISSGAAEIDVLEERDFFEAAILSATLKLEEAKELVQQEYRPAARHLIFRWRSKAQALLGEKEGVFLPLRRPDFVRSMCFISAGVDLIRAQLEYGVLTDDARSSAVCFEHAGMPKVAYAVTQKYIGPSDLFAVQVPRDNAVRSLEEQTLAGFAVNFSRLHVS